jgi:hypothetical protein
MCFNLIVLFTKKVIKQKYVLENVGALNYVSFDFAFQ